jgi:hypothetical protein
MIMHQRRRASFVASVGTLTLGLLAATTQAVAQPQDATGGEPADKPAAAGATVPSADQAYAQLQKEFAEANKAYRDRASALQKEHGKDWQKFSGEPPQKAFLARFAEAATTYAGQEGAAPFLIAVVQLGRQLDPAAAKSALSTLAKDHVSHPRLQDLAFTLWQGDAQFGTALIDTTLDAIVAGTKDDQVKAAMLFARGSRRNGPKATEKQRATAIDDLRTAAKLGAGTRYGEMAGGTIFELEHLQIGMVAPDIESADLEGTTFKLSDYRGKVVVLDFWGDW